MHRWQNVLARFTTWFAVALASGDHALADRFAFIVFAIKEVSTRPPCGLHELLDFLDKGELANLERKSETPDLGSLAEIAASYHAMLQTHVGPDLEGRGSCDETPPPYVSIAPGTRSRS